MHEIIVPFAFLFAALSAPGRGQTRSREHFLNPAAATAHVAGRFLGKWTYRGDHNRPEVVVNENAALALSLVSDEGAMTVESTARAGCIASFIATRQPRERTIP